MSDADGTCEYILDPDDPETWGGEEGDECYVDEDVLNEDGVWTCPHEAEEGEYLCIFHLPVEEKDDEEVVESFLSILDKVTVRNDPAIQERKHQFIGTKFGDFDLSENHVEITMEKGEIVLNHAKVDGKLDWSESTFDMSGTQLAGFECVNNASFASVEFKGDSDFRGADFGGRAEFEHVVFNRDAYFVDSEFGRAANFENAQFGQVALFTAAEFKRHAGFRHAEFEGVANFVMVEFREDGEFGSVVGGAVFDDDAQFHNAEFREDADFKETEFRGKADFGDVKFFGNAEFHDSEFWKRTSFRRAEFEGNAKFSDVDFAGDVHFVDANFGEYITSFERTTFDKNADFSEQELVKCVFEYADLTDATFNNATLVSANFESALFSRATLFRADLRGAKLSGAVFGDMRIDEDTKFLGHPSGDGNTSPHTLSAIRSQPTCVYDSDYEKDNEHEDVDKAKSVYRALEELGGKHARPRLQTRSFVRRQDLQKDEYKQDAREAESWEERLIAGARWSRARVARVTLLYGESPWRVIGWSLGIILSFALLYPLGGFIKEKEATGPVSYSEVSANIGTDTLGWFSGVLGVFGDSVYYSTMTYTALGLGDFKPVGLGRALTTIETGLGAVMLALLVFILGRRAAR